VAAPLHDANIAMSRLLILGATGSLGRHVLRQALAAGHVVTVFVRTPSKLRPEVRERVSVHTGDLSAVVPPDLIRGQDALINCAGHVGERGAFVGLVDRASSPVWICFALRSSRSAGFSQARRSSTSIRPGVAASIYRALSRSTGHTGSTSSD
jgi:putative NAD(P)-binding protein